MPELPNASDHRSPHHGKTRWFLSPSDDRLMVDVLDSERASLPIIDFQGWIDLVESDLLGSKVGIRARMEAPGASTRTMSVGYFGEVIYVDPSGELFVDGRLRVDEGLMTLGLILCAGPRYDFTNCERFHLHLSGSLPAVTCEATWLELSLMASRPLGAA